MRSRIIFPVLLFVAGALVLPHIAHASIPFFGPIVPQSINLCPAGWGMMMVVVNNIIEFLLTLMIVFVAPVMIAYAGFLFVINPVNPSEKQKAKSVLTNTVIGIVIALSAWLVVDAIMATLYTPPGGSAWSTWSNLIISDKSNPCLLRAGSLYQLNQSVGSPSITGTGASGNPTLSFGTGACDAATLQQLVPSLSLNQANTFACLAKPESACGSTMQNYSWNVGNKDGIASTAYGAFQITLSSNHSCFENQACYTAAGVSGPLNCQNGFGPKGFTAGGDPTILANCMRAAADLACNATAAACVLGKQGFGAWTADAHSSTQTQCIATYGG